MLTRVIRGTRGFARFAKGGFGKESTLAANSGMPKHKELFQDGYYQGDEGNEYD